MEAIWIIFPTSAIIKINIQLQYTNLEVVLKNGNKKTKFHCRLLYAWFTLPIGLEGYLRIT